MADRKMPKGSLLTAVGASAVLNFGAVGTGMLCGAFNRVPDNLWTFAAQTQIVQQLDRAQDRQMLSVDWNKARQEQAASVAKETMKNEKDGKMFLSLGALGLVGFVFGARAMRKSAAPGSLLSTILKQP